MLMKFFMFVLDKQQEIPVAKSVWWFLVLALPLWLALEALAGVEWLWLRIRRN